jgi:hypothetical protein
VTEIAAIRVIEATRVKEIGPEKEAVRAIVVTGAKIRRKSHFPNQKLIG